MPKNNFPLHYLTWNVTADCNLKCKHCYNNPLNKDKKFDEMSIEEGKDMIQQALPLGLKAILFTGGEPLLKKNILTLLKFAKNRNLSVFLATNGTLIDKNFIKNFRGIVDRINISLDGSSAEKHDAIRGIKGSFSKTIKSIANLSKKFSVSISFTAHSQNLDDLPSVAKIAKKYKVPLTIKRFVSIGEGSRNSELTLSQSKYKILVKEVNNLKKTYRIFFRDPFPSSYNKNIDSYSGCLAGISFLDIDFNGNIYPCTKLKVLLGNVRNDSLEKIWNNSKTLEKLRKRKLKGKCKGCERIFSCGGCRAAAYAKTGDFLDEDPLCFYQRSIRKNKF